MVRGAADYYHRTIIVKLSADMKIYQTCKFMNPLAMRLSAGLAGAAVIRLSANFVELVSALGRDTNTWGPQCPSRFSRVQIAALVKVWPAYISLCRQMPVDANDADPEHIMLRSTEFWRAVRANIPNLALLARYAFTIVLSSAAAERVFSLLKRFFSFIRP